MARQFMPSAVMCTPLGIKCSWLFIYQLLPPPLVKFVSKGEVIWSNVLQEKIQVASREFIQHLIMVTLEMMRFLTVLIRYRSLLHESHSRFHRDVSHSDEALHIHMTRHSKYQLIYNRCVAVMNLNHLTADVVI